MIRVSTLEAFRQFLHDEEAEHFNPVIPETPAMRAGTAFHKALEMSQPGEYPELSALGHRFIIQCDIGLYLPPAREIRGYRSYGMLPVTGQVDDMDGHRIEDHKTTATPNLERYLDGYQWRFYLDMFGASVFRWNVFTLKQSDDDSLCYFVTGLDHLEQYRYPGMHRDCRELARAFCAYHESNRSNTCQ